MPGFAETPETSKQAKKLKNRKLAVHTACRLGSLLCIHDDQEGSKALPLNTMTQSNGHPPCITMDPDCSSYNRPSVSSIEKDIDPYKILALRRDATFAEIVGAYRRLAVLKHPRRQCSVYSSNNTGEFLADSSDSLREWDFLVLSACYEILRTPRYRRAYDDLYKRHERRNRLRMQRQQKAARRKNKPADSLLPINGLTCLGRGSNRFGQGREEHNTIIHRDSVHSSQCDVGAFLKLSFDSDNEIPDSPSIENSLSGEDDFRSVQGDFADKSEMYEGPLELLYRARNYENFADPYDVVRNETCLFMNLVYFLFLKSICYRIILVKSPVSK